MRHTLEKYSGPGSRHTCPACGAKKRFTRYIDAETGRYIADHVGRCDRESSCGYHLKPGEYFDANGGGSKPGISWQDRKGENGSRANYPQRFSARTPDFIDKRLLIASLRNYGENSFVQFLFDLFPFDPEDVIAAVNEYKIGTGRNGEAIFWQIDGSRLIRTGKLIEYDQNTGKRRKDRTPNWIHSTMKQAGQLPDTFELQQCLFGEHLLTKYPSRAIAIVEAEKTAVIASICKGVFPDLVWIACGGLSNLKAETLSRIANGRKLILFPDANGFAKWQRIASEAVKCKIAVSVSDLLERLATDDQKRDGLDLADYLIDEQRKRNDPSNRAAFRDLIEERLAIMTIDGGLSEEQAEAEILTSGFYQATIRSVIDSSRKLGNSIYPIVHLGGHRFLQIDRTGTDKDRSNYHNYAKCEAQFSRNVGTITNKRNLENLDTLENEVYTEKPNHNLQKSNH